MVVLTVFQEWERSTTQVWNQGMMTQYLGLSLTTMPQTKIYTQPLQSLGRLSEHCKCLDECVCVCVRVCVRDTFYVCVCDSVCACV